MKKCNFWWVIIIAVIILVVWAYSPEKTSEGFDILGALAPFKDGLNKCVSECEREDPTKRLLASGNLGCDAYCQSYFTGLARAGLPPKNVVTSYDTCEIQCSKAFAKSPLSKDKCISMCHCHNETKKWCRELQCPYTDLDAAPCMKQCIANTMTNCNQVSWTWKKHG